MRNFLVLMILILLFTGCGFDSRINDNLETLANVLNDGPISDISVKELFGEVIGTENGIGVTDFNVSITSDGYVNSLNISFSDSNMNEDVTYVYRRAEKISNSYKHTDVDSVGLHTGSLAVLDIFDNNIKLGNLNMEPEELMIYELVSPSEISISVNEGDIVDGKFIDESLDVVGIAFFYYKSPVDKEDVGIVNVTTDYK